MKEAAKAEEREKHCADPITRLEYVGNRTFRMPDVSKDTNWFVSGRRNRD